MGDTEDPRQAAVGRLRAKQAFWGQFAIYLVVNAFLVVLWAVEDPRKSFWPIWVIGFWGLGLGVQAWALWGQKPLSEDAIQREMERGGSG